MVRMVLHQPKQEMDFVSITSCLKVMGHGRFGCEVESGFGFGTPVPPGPAWPAKACLLPRC